MNAYRRPIPNDLWLRQIFSSRSAQTGGVVRRSVEDVERKIGRNALELEVRRRGYHMLEAGGQFIIICTRSPLQVVV